MEQKFNFLFATSTDDGKEFKFECADDGKLYVNRKAIVTTEKVVLQGWVNLAIIFTAVAAITQSVCGVLTYLNTVDSTHAEVARWKGVASQGTTAFVASHGGKIPKGTRVMQDGNATFIIGFSSPGN